jgi:hypothetical protein
VPHPSSPPLDGVGPQCRPSATARRPGTPPHTAAKAVTALHRCRAIRVSAALHRCHAVLVRAALPHLARCPLRTPPSLLPPKTAHLGCRRDRATRSACGRGDHVGSARTAPWLAGRPGPCWPVGCGPNAACYCAPKKFFSELILILGIRINFKNP